MVDGFPERLRRRREELGLTTQAVGHQVGVHAIYIERLEEGTSIPKPEVARRLAQILQEAEAPYLEWSRQRSESDTAAALSRPRAYPRYPEAREALIELCEDPDAARQLLSGSAIGPLEAALYGLLIDRMSHRMGDLGFWGFLPPKDEVAPTPHGRLLLEAFFEMLTHPEGETADYKKVFSELIASWRYGPTPHRISVRHPSGQFTVYRLALVDQEGSILPALEPEDPFYALYRMLTPQQRSDIASLCRIFLRRDPRLEIQAALSALKRWHEQNEP